MKLLSNSRNSIVWNVVAIFTLIGILTYCAIDINSINQATDIIGSNDYGSELFMLWMFIIASSIAIVYNLLRIVYKIKQSTEKINEN